MIPPSLPPPVPGENSPTPLVSVRWFYSRDGTVIGPMPLASLQALWKAGELPSDTLAVQEGREDWQSLSDVLGTVSKSPTAPVHAAKPTPSAHGGSFGAFSSPPVMPTAPPLPIVSALAVAPSDSSTPIHSMKGRCTLLEVFRDKVEITPQGIIGFINRGAKGTKTLPFHSITAIQFKEAGWTIGYLQFTIPGGNESKGGVLAAVKDENTFLFTKQQNGNERARQIKLYIESRIKEARVPNPASKLPASSMADELKKLAVLREQGILSDDEFQAAKKRLLSAS